MDKVMLMLYISLLEDYKLFYHNEWFYSRRGPLFKIKHDCIERQLIYKYGIIK